MQLKSVRIFVHDLAAAKLFYSDRLGLPLHYDGQDLGFCLFRPGDVAFIVESVPNDAPGDDLELVGRFTGLSFTVVDIHAKYAELLEKGIEFTEKPERQAWGGTLATFKDQAGNTLQLVQEAAGQ